MRLIKNESVEAVATTANFYAAVLERVLLAEQGSQLVGRCPFHEEQTPSFSVNLEHGLFYCFGCRKSGDIITFVRETQDLDFPGAIEWLGRRFNIPIKHESRLGGWLRGIGVFRSR